MNPGNVAAGLGPRRGKREVIEVAERKVQDKRLDQLLHVRKQRLSRLERECNEARSVWRRRRQKLHQVKQIWRDAVERTQSEWRTARQEFTNMTITSGQFRSAKAIYERMKKEAAQLYLDCQNELSRCRDAGRLFFAARLAVLTANKQQEKLSILRDEIRALEQAAEN
ncbi:hypothetical protein [Herbaspirillum sp. RV1423]|uniref:hypothetical protein n=1 Tax=Herbaspirillum sp. RV1423 TaxID=1443993 RepID=UPI0004AD29A2|nr:hypothetical protein [Herbaspirillum sp. RV1423]